MFPNLQMTDAYPIDTLGIRVRMTRGLRNRCSTGHHAERGSYANLLLSRNLNVGL